MPRNPPIVLEHVESDATSARARFRVGTKATTIGFDNVAPDERSAAEAFAAIAKIMGIETRQKVICWPRLSPSFRRSINTYQELHLHLFPLHSVARMLSRARRDRPPLADDQRRSAAFFSGGVDSMDLVIEHADEIDDLIFVRGFDIEVHDVERNDEVQALVQAAADAVGKPLLVIETDLRDFSDPVTNWTWYAYAGLISTTLMLERTHRQVFAAASVADLHMSDEIGRLRALGIGNDRIQMRLEGRKATRVQKSERVATSGLARSTLRVCWQNIPGSINCGRCEKCVRTQVSLAACGVLDQIDTLPHEVDLDVVASHPTKTRSDRAFTLEARDAAREHGVTDLADALDRALAASNA